MKKKTIALILCIALAVTVLPFTIAAAADEYRAQVALAEEKKAAEEAVSAQNQITTVKEPEKARCGVCNEQVDVNSLKPMNCGKHKVCPDCLQNENKSIQALVKLHSNRLVCGDYGCDNHGHYNKPYEFCPTHEHYACTDGDHLHTCETCGKEYDCITAGNIHAICPNCKKAWCRGDHSFCPGCHEFRCKVSRDHSVCGENGCTLLNCVDHEHCPKCGTAALPNISGHKLPCGHLLCDTDIAPDHSACAGCGVFKCSDGYEAEKHQGCSWCNGYICDGKAHGPCPIGTEPCSYCLSAGGHAACSNCGGCLRNGSDHTECATCHGYKCGGTNPCTCPKDS